MVKPCSQAKRAWFAPGVADERLDVDSTARIWRSQNECQQHVPYDRCYCLAVQPPAGRSWTEGQLWLLCPCSDSGARRASPLQEGLRNTYESGKSPSSCQRTSAPTHTNTPSPILSREFQQSKHITRVLFSLVSLAAHGAKVHTNDPSWAFACLWGFGGV